MSYDSKKPLLSLILCTVGRTSELIIFLQSIWPGSEEVQLVIVDQNCSSLLIEDFLDLNPQKFHSINHIKVEKKSLSWARNRGLAVAKGQFIGYPDDDCVYCDNLITSIIELLQENKKEDPDFKGIVLNFPGCKPLNSKQHITSLDLPGRVISFSFFIKANVDIRKNLFREDLGVGNFYGAGEETEYLLRILGGSGYLEAHPKFLVQHPEKSNSSYLREIKYGRGFGALSFLYLKHMRFRSILIFLKIIVGPFLKSFFLLATFRFKESSMLFLSALSRLSGLFLFAIKYKRVD